MPPLQNAVLSNRVLRSPFGMRHLLGRTLLGPLLFMTTAIASNASAETSSPAPTANEHVILLHGLARSPKCMKRLEKSLSAQGYVVHNIGYPSRQSTAEILVEKHIGPAFESCRAQGAERIHVVAHSLGGILLRLYARDHKISDLGRVVMLGPPNQGSEIVDKLGHLSLYRWINGPVGSQLGTKGEAALASTLGPVDFELGIIAGSRSINVILSRFIAGRDDGKVSVENTRVEGAQDHTVIRCSHPYLMSSRQSIDLVRRFLATGSFGTCGK